MQPEYFGVGLKRIDHKGGEFLFCSDRGAAVESSDVTKDGGTQPIKDLPPKRPQVGVARLAGFRAGEHTQILIVLFFLAGSLVLGKNGERAP